MSFIIIINEFLLIEFLVLNLSRWLFSKRFTMLFATFILLTRSKLLDENYFEKGKYTKCKGYIDKDFFTYYCQIDEICAEGNKCKRQAEILRNPKYFYLIWFIILSVELIYYMIIGWKKNTFTVRNILLFLLEQFYCFAGWTFLFSIIAVKYDLTNLIGILFGLIALIGCYFAFRGIASIESIEYTDLEEEINTFLQDTSVLPTFNITDVNISAEYGKNVIFVRDSFYKLELDVTYLIYPDETKSSHYEKYVVYRQYKFPYLMFHSKILWNISIIFGFSSFYQFYDASRYGNRDHLGNVKLQIVKDGMKVIDMDIDHPNTFEGSHTFEMLFSAFKYQRIK